jgi:hypothetical protein
VVDKETQKNDLDIVREVLKVTNEVPIERAYDFSFAKKADSELTQASWKPKKLSRVGALRASARKEKPGVRGSRVALDLLSVRAPAIIPAIRISKVDFPAR